MYRWLARFIVIFVAITGLAVPTSAFASPSGAEQGPPQPPLLTRVTGADLSTTARFGVDATDLMIPFADCSGSMNFLGGDTFDTPMPGVGNWRSPVMLRSDQTPVPGQPLVFDSAAGLTGDGNAPDIMRNGHQSGGEYSVIPTDGICIPEAQLQIVSYMSIQAWWPTPGVAPDPAWTDNYAGLAVSFDGGNHFERFDPPDPQGPPDLHTPNWPESPGKNDPYQVMSMQRDGDYVYIISVEAGRKAATNTRMMLQRVPWMGMLDKGSYQCWTGASWSSNYGTCQPLLTGSFGEPSLRLLSDGTWAMSYMDASAADAPWIVTRTASSPTGPWSAPKTQLTWDQNPFMYGGFIYPRSTRDNLLLMISTWIPPDSGLAPRYDVSVYKSRL